MPARRAAGSFLADLSDGGTLAATHVIVATGGFQAPVVPAIARGFGAQIPQWTPSASAPASPARRTGAGGDGPAAATAVLASASHPVMLATGKPRAGARARAGSIDLVVRSLGLMRASSASFIGKAGAGTPFPIVIAAWRAWRRGIELRPRLTAAEGDTAVFADGERRKVAAVVGLAIGIGPIGSRSPAPWAMTAACFTTPAFPGARPCLCRPSVAA